MSDAIQKVDTLEFTLDQRKMIRDSFLSGASEPEAAMLMELARVRKLNPITRQIHFVKRWDSNKNCEVWSAQVGIDGFRSIAERTGRYDGQDEPEFEYDAKGAMKLCRVKVYRKDWSRPSVGLAHFSEYAQYKKDKSLTSMWATKPHVMLAKCAEALAFRKAFPEDMSGLCSSEEMGGNGEPPPEPTPPPPGKTQTTTVKEAIEAKRASQQTVDVTPVALPPIRAQAEVSPKKATTKPSWAIQDDPSPLTDADYRGQS
jgi:phage recombination protein Bet